MTAHDEPTAVDETTLLGTLRAFHDQAPHTLIDACAARGEPMVQAIEALIRAPAFWSRDADVGSWWQRLHAAMILGLLDFPRDRHRALIDDFVARQRGLGKRFDAEDVETAYARGEDEPERHRFADPWRFYEAEAIAVRQKRWADEDRERTQGNRYTSQHALGSRLEPFCARRAQDRPQRAVPLRQRQKVQEVLSGQGGLTRGPSW